jgi:alpha-1,3-rhamnosyl/mannosyltransferase
MGCEVIELFCEPDSRFPNHHPDPTVVENMRFAIDARYIQDHFPGIGRYTHDLIHGLARVAPDDTFVVLHNPQLPNTHYDVSGFSRYPNVELRRVNVPTFSLSEQVRLLPRGSGAALFHSPYYVKPYFVRLPSIVTIFDLVPLFYPAALPNASRRVLFRLTMGLAVRTSTRIIVPSFSTCEDLVKRLGVLRGKIDVIPLAADSRWAPASMGEIARVRERYALPPNYVLSVGINKPHKNLTTLVDAWQKIDREGVALIIAGAWDSRYAGIRAQVEEQRDHSAGEIRFIHDVADRDLIALYSGATAFVMPSLYEGFGLPALEAMACGAPVIVSNVSSLPQVVGDAAILVNPRDINEIADAIARVLSDPAQRQEMCAKSIARAARFTWERAARETLQVYERVINASRTSAAS